MVVSTESRRGNKFAQVATDFDWTSIHPVAYRSEAHETLSLLFARDDVPPSTYATTPKR